MYYQYYHYYNNYFSNYQSFTFQKLLIRNSITNDKTRHLYSSIIKKKEKIKIL